MTTPCVLYVQRRQFGRRTSIDFHGTTSRNEEIRGMVSWKFDCDPVGILLTIDDVPIKAPNNLDYEPACDWIIQQVASLGYHVIEINKSDIVTY